MLNPARNANLDTAIEQAVARYEAATPNSRARYEQACDVMPGGNTRSVLHFAPYPLTFVHGEGVSLRDLDGLTYTDFLGEYTASVRRHCTAIAANAGRDKSPAAQAPRSRPGWLASIPPDRLSKELPPGQ